MPDNILFCASLKDAFASVAMTYPERGMVAGKMIRFSTDGKPKDTAGWCKLFPDGVGAVFGCNREGTTYTWQLRDVNVPAPSKAEREAAHVKHELVKQQAALDQASQYANAAIVAATKWNNSVEVNKRHAYIVRKGIIPYYGRQDSAGSIVLPLYGADGLIQSLQTILLDGDKKFFINATMKGGRLIIGKALNGSPLTLVEGWATGCSIHEATGAAVVICFSGCNLDDVAADIRIRYPDSKLCIAGDLDAHGKGLEYAQAAAAVSAPSTVFIPAFEDGRVKGDFNDLHQAQGLEAVRLQLAAKPDTSTREVAPFMQPQIYLCDARDGTATTRPLSEFGNAQRLSDTASHRLKFIYATKSWIIWNGASWCWNCGAAVRTLATSLPDQIYAEGNGDMTNAPHFMKWARKSQEKRTIDASVALLADFTNIRLPQEKIDANPFIIGFNHSTQIINLHDGTVRAATTNDYVTKSLSAETIGNADKAVRWMQFLEQVFCGDQELIDWMHLFCGYLLTGTTQEQIFLFCYGHGANGKSVFIEVLNYIMGNYSRAIASESLSESKRQAGSATPDLAALVGARLVICSETEDNSALSESLLKGLVSGDSMAVRPLYAAPIQLTPNFKLVMAGNHKPIIKGNDNGIWRRVRLVPFNRTFSPEERDPHLLTKLRAEAPHILAWMVRGCVNWQKQGLTNIPQTIRQATEEYRIDQDLIGAWLSESTSLDSQASVVTAELYQNYKAWCVQNGHMSFSSTALGRRLAERGFIAAKASGVRVWRGLRLTDSRHECNAQAYVNRKGG
jgi:P4 family phage/plasmid primase-like protien